MIMINTIAVPKGCSSLWRGRTRLPDVLFCCFFVCARREQPFGIVMICNHKAKTSKYPEAERSLHERRKGSQMITRSRETGKGNVQQWLASSWQESLIFIVRCIVVTANIICKRITLERIIYERVHLGNLSEMVCFHWLQFRAGLMRDIEQTHSSHKYIFRKPFYSKELLCFGENLWGQERLARRTQWGTEGKKSVHHWD